MKVFSIEFIGRTKGSIGIMYPIKEEVIAEDFDSAILKLYEKYDHISPQCQESGLSVEERWAKSINVQDINL